jgi:hypothetical protein
MADAEVAIQEWLETAKGLGRDIPEARGRLVPVGDDQPILRSPSSKGKLPMSVLT